MTVHDGVFYPTETSKIIIDYLSEKKRRFGRILDLGCGCGVVGITLSKLGAFGKFCASDISEKAVNNTRANLKKYKLDADVRISSLYDAWKGNRFDSILCDVSGVSEEIAKISPWFGKNIDCASGKDGTELVTKIINATPNYLTPRGILVLPVLTLSKHAKLISCLKKNFHSVKRVTSRQFYLPKEMAAHKKTIERLNRLKYIDVEEKFGLYLWRTDLYEVHNGRPS